MGLPVIRTNSAVCVRYRDPAYEAGFVYPAKRLRGAIEPPRVLKPGDHHQGGHGHHGHHSWKPQIGMAPARQQASLMGAGHRMLGHHVPRGRGGGQYSSVPPPMSGMSSML